MDQTQSFRFFNRGPSSGVRLVFFSALSLALMFVDARFRYLESARSVLSVLVMPIQQLATSPMYLWDQIGGIFITQQAQHNLQLDNKRLQLQHQQDTAQLQQLQAMRLENQQLRNLAQLPVSPKFSAQLAEVIYAERDVFKRKVLISKGVNAKIEVGQVVMDNAGIVGQITRVFPWLSEVTLITEKDRAVPVQVLRNGLRSIVFGAGDTSQLSLRFMPEGADIQSGDILVTSGIDGVYPPGISVAKVEKVERDPSYPFARITCVPTAGVDRHRHLLVLSNLPKLPERPAEESANDEADKRAKQGIK
ncbi:MAG: rod shape-determining protein MreC [Gallionella sp.]|nr:rod shape-determining protein MreC [Gallionella sp.]